MTLYILMTGYGPFLNITENPSDDLAKKCGDFWPKTFSNTNIKLLARETVPVDPISVHTVIEKFQALINNKRSEDPNSHFLCIHIGVNGNIKKRHIEFERYCYNSKIFDDSGAIVNTSPSVYEEIGHDKKIECKFDIEKVVRSVSNHNPFAAINDDPGRYLCNYIYLRSSVDLCMDQDDVDCFFLHIPDNFDDLDYQKDTMFQFVIRYAGMFHSEIAFD